MAMKYRDFSQNRHREIRTDTTEPMLYPSTYSHPWCLIRYGRQRSKFPTMRMGYITECIRDEAGELVKVHAYVRSPEGVWTVRDGIYDFDAVLYTWRRRPEFRAIVNARAKILQAPLHPQPLERHP